MDIIVSAKPPKEQPRTLPTERATLLTVVASVAAVVLAALRLFMN